MADEYTLPTLLRLITSSHSSVINFSKKAVVSANGGEDQLTASMDRLCLALALLTNLVQEVENLAEVLQSHRKFI